MAPDHAWRTVETAHVRVTYPAPRDSLGERTARAAERAWEGLARLAPPPGGRVEVVLSDDVDVANAFASVSPYPWIVVYVHPPYDNLDLAEYSDWLEVVLAHEMAHIVHLDQARGLGRFLRQIFGRIPAAGWPLFPHVTTPTWTIEGLAVRYETALTGSGRLAGTVTEMIVRAAAVEDEIPDLGFVTGDPAVWPAGNTRYAFGGEFLGWLAARHGDEAFEQYVRELAGDPLPFRVDRAAERAFGVTFSDAWEAWRVEATARNRAAADSLARVAPLTRAERLMNHAYWALWPRWSPDGATIAYAAYDGRRDVHLARIDAGSGAEIGSTRVPGLGVPSWRSDGSLVVGGFQWQGPYRRWDDLWVIPGEGPARPLTDAARLSHPDVGPGGAIVAVQTEAGTNRLVVLEPGNGEPRAVTALDAGVHWAWPRWSPDGSRIAVSRWRGRGFDVVVLDPAGGLEREIAADGALNLAPAWSPDGGWLVFGSDRTGIANLYAFDLGGRRGLRQVTHVGGGAFFPDVSPDGRWIAFAGYHHDGWAIERVPFDPAAWFDPHPARDASIPRAWSAASTGSLAAAPSDVLPSRRKQEPIHVSVPRPYAPWPTLVPRYWLPIVEAGEEVRGRELLGPGVGAATSAVDAVGRHAYGAASTVDVEHGRVEAFVRYRNAVLGRPILDLTAAQTWEFAGFALPASEEETAQPGDTLFALGRNREIALFATIPFRHPFRSATLAMGAGLLEERLVLLEPDLTESRRFRLDDPRALLPEAFGSGTFSTARTFAFSISPENGIAGSARGEWRFDPAEENRARREATAQVAVYRALGRPWGFARTVAALRASGGVVRGLGAGDGHFALGGASGEGLGVAGLTGLGAQRFLLPVRGYVRGERRGRTAWSASAEIRFPLALLQKGWGLRPLFLDRLAGTVFVDAGDAWDPCRPGAECTASLEPLVSSGVELLLDVTVFYRLPLTLRFGVARTLVDPVGTTAYLRLGRSF
ncbi:MAG: M48 family metalloprotease [Gemmatimonadota bacterium]